jgi:predicted aminopeptidase
MTPKSDSAMSPAPSRRRRPRTVRTVTWCSPTTGRVDSALFRQRPAAERLADRLRAQGVAVEIAVGAIASWNTE